MADGASSVIKFSAGGNSEQMRLTSTGLGIGTSSPDVKLSVVGDAKLTGAGTYTILTMADATASGSSWALASGFPALGDFTIREAGVANWLIIKKTSGDSIFGGNVGVGVTPSAWNSAYKAVQVGVSGGASFFGGSGFAGMAYNYSVNTSGQEIYTTTNASLQYVQVVGQHRWYNAPSGTAGNAITFTQAMTLDASGRLGVGETSPAHTLSLKTASSTYIKLAADFGDAYIGMETVGDEFRFVTANPTPMVFFTNNTERARITSAGVVAINPDGSGSGNKLDIYGGGSGALGALVIGDGTLSAGHTNYWNIGRDNITSGAFTFALNGSEKARIDTSGSLLVGTTSSSGSISNFIPTYSGVFKTAQGSISTTSGVATTLFTAPGSFSSYFVTVWINADDAINYQAVISVNTQPNGSIKLNTIVSANLFTFSLSGYNVQVTQLSGGTATVNYCATRIAG
jgi:hypothetical protein